MKKITIIALLCMLCVSCFPYLNTYSNVIDFSPYTAKGFYLTPASSLEQRYQPLGEVSVFVSNYLDGRKNMNTAMMEEIERDVILQNLARHFNIKDQEIGVYEYALCHLINRAMNLGADAILNLQISEIAGQSGLGELYVSGFAIKRE